MTDIEDWSPLDEAESARQISGLLQLARDKGDGISILDLGCGSGRLAVPLSSSGCRVVAVDHDRKALDVIADACGGDAPELLQLDVLDASSRQMLQTHGPWDLVLCLGHTFMTFPDVDDAADLMIWIRLNLHPDGALILDDFPFPLWSELVEGGWGNGTTEDGAFQMSWEPGDALFVFRSGDEVRSEPAPIEASERPCRLWSMGALRLLARHAGLQAPLRDAESGILIFQR